MKQRYMKDSLIKKQYVLINIVLVIITVIAFLSIQGLKKNYQKEIQKSLKTVNNAVHSAYLIWIDNLKTDIEQIAKDQVVIKLTEELIQCPPDSLNLATCEAQLKLRKYLKPHLNANNYLGFFIISVENNISYGSTRNTNIGTENLISKEQPQLFENVKKGDFIVVPPVISDVRLESDNPEIKELTMFTGAPIKDSKGKIIAILTLRINPLQQFTKIAHIGQIGLSGESYGIDPKGIMITQSRFEESLAEIGLIQPNTKSILNVKITNPGGNMLDNYRPSASNNDLPLTLAAESVLKKESGSNFQGYNDYRGLSVLGTWIWDETLQFGLITEINADEALLPYYNSRNIVLLMLFITIVLVLLLTFIIIKSTRKNRLKLKKINEQLEDKVKIRTKELTLSNKGLGLEIGKHKITQKELIDKNKELKNAFTKLKKTQSKLIQSEKMASLGSLIAGIAHEINTPIGAIKASIANLNKSMSNILNEFVFGNSEIDSSAKKLIKNLYGATEELKPELSTREKRALRKEFTEKLQSEGIDQSREVADILVYMGIRANLDELIPSLKRDDLLSILENSKNIASINKNHKTIGLAVDKAGKTVFALKKFSHTGNTGEKIQFSIVENIETVLIIYSNILKQGVELEKKFDEVPLINGYPDELTQVWTNLIHNATQAMNQNGIMKIEIKYLNGKIIVSIRDSGSGISKDIREKIFEPFFTTKPIGEGTGIGLDIVKKIIKNHNGNIYFESEIGIGTTFYVELPVQ